MTKLAIPYETDIRTTTLTKGSVIRRGNDIEFVTNVFYDRERLVRFWAARRNGDEIKESHYSVNAETRIPHLDLVGTLRKDQQSGRYSELNAILEEFEKKQK